MQRSVWVVQLIMCEKKSQELSTESTQCTKHPFFTMQRPAEKGLITSCTCIILIVGHTMTLSFHQRNECNVSKTIYVDFNGKQLRTIKVSQRERTIKVSQRERPWGQPKRVGHGVSQRQRAMGPAKESKQLGLAQIIFG